MSVNCQKKYIHTVCIEEVLDTKIERKKPTTELLSGDMGSGRVVKLTSGNAILTLNEGH
jgi:hypothetical protein